MTKTKSHWFRMVYIEVQDQKKKKTLKFRMKKMSYKLFRLIGTQSIENRISAKTSKRKKHIPWPFKAQITSRFFQYLKHIIN